MNSIQTLKAKGLLKALPKLVGTSANVNVGKTQVAELLSNVQGEMGKGVRAMLNEHFAGAKKATVQLNYKVKDNYAIAQLRLMDGQTQKGNIALSVSDYNTHMPEVKFRVNTPGGELNGNGFTVINREIPLANDLSVEMGVKNGIDKLKLRSGNAIGINLTGDIEKISKFIPKEVANTNQTITRFASKARDFLAEMFFPKEVRPCNLPKIKIVDFPTNMKLIKNLGQKITDPKTKMSIIKTESSDKPSTKLKAEIKEIFEVNSDPKKKASIEKKVEESSEKEIKKSATKKGKDPKIKK